MDTPEQAPAPLAIAVSGAAGSGKSTLGRELARALRAPAIDLDTVTNPLLDRLAPGLLDAGGHWLASGHADRIRAGRYAALRATAAEVVATTGLVVLIAPFTAELRGAREWDELVAELAPATVRMVHLHGDERLLQGRRTARGEQRDQFRPATAPDAPVIEVIEVDACLPTVDQMALVLAALALPGR